MEYYKRVYTNALGSAEERAKLAVNTHVTDSLVTALIAQPTTR